MEMGAPMTAAPSKWAEAELCRLWQKSCVCGEYERRGNSFACHPLGCWPRPKDWALALDAAREVGRREAVEQVRELINRSMPDEEDLAWLKERVRALLAETKEEK